METLLDPHLDYAMQSAILSGLVQDSDTVTQQLSVACSTGNCTWDPIQSLGICRRCTNVASMLTRSVVSGMPLPVMLSPDSATMQGNVTRYSLRNGLYIENLPGLSQLNMTTFGTGNPAATVSMQDLDTLIWSMSILRVQSDPTNASAKWPDLPIEATECALYYCVQGYNMAMEGNQIKQNSSELSSFRRLTDSWLPYRLSPTGDISWATLNSTAQESLAWDQTSSVNRTDLTLSDQHQQFNVSFDAVRSISMSFSTNFHANLSFENVTGYWMDLGTGPDFKPDVLQILKETEDLNDRFETLALSMSNAIRMSKKDTTAVHGRLGQPVIKYRIEWPWITMPIIIVLASLIQLLITMHSSRARPILKSSILAVLSRGPYVNGVFDGAETVKDLRDAASHENICLFDMTEPMISPRHAKKFSIGSSTYTALSSPELTKDGHRLSPLHRRRSSHWADDSSTVVGDGNGDTRTNSSIIHGLGISSDESPLVSPRRAFLSSYHERSRSGNESQETLLQELQETCHLFRSDTRGPR